MIVSNYPGNESHHGTKKTVPRALLWFETRRTSTILAPIMMTTPHSTHPPNSLSLSHPSSPTLILSISLCHSLLHSFVHQLILQFNRVPTLLSVMLWSKPAHLTASALLTSLALGVRLHGRDTNAPLLESYDYIVVGCGISGLVVTNRLSEIESRTVLCIEAGDA